VRCGLRFVLEHETRWSHREAGGLLSETLRKVRAIRPDVWCSTSISARVELPSIPQLRATSRTPRSSCSRSDEPASPPEALQGGRGGYVLKEPPTTACRAVARRRAARPS